MMLTSKEANILKILDDAARAYQFPLLNNKYLTSAGILLHVFTSPEEWLIVFDHVCFSEKHGFIHDLTALGNKITNQVWTSAIPVFDEHEQPKLVQSQEDGINRITPPYIRFGLDESIFVIQPQEGFAYSVLHKDAAVLTPGELLRAITSEHIGYLLISDQQLLEMLGRSNNELKLLFQPGDWQHPDIANGELPGDVPCFVSLAKAIAASDERLFQCEEDRFNTHWSNWE
jgi:hypothetical protein